MNKRKNEQYISYTELKSEVQLQNDIIVTFHDDPFVNYGRRGVVEEHGFKLGTSCQDE